MQQGIIAINSDGVEGLYTLILGIRGHRRVDLEGAAGAVGKQVFFQIVVGADQGQCAERHLIVGLEREKSIFLVVFTGDVVDIAEIVVVGIFGQCRISKIGGCPGQCIHCVKIDRTRFHVAVAGGGVQGQSLRGLPDHATADIFFLQVVTGVILPGELVLELAISIPVAEGDATV